MKKVIKPSKVTNLPHWSEKYHYGGELFLPALAAFFTATALLTAGSVFFGAASAKVLYQDDKCRGSIQYGAKCYGERTLLITAASDTLLALGKNFKFYAKLLPLIKIDKPAGTFGRKEGRNLFIPDVKNFNPLANNQYPTRVWQLNETSRLAAVYYFDDYAKKLKLRNWKNLPGWFSAGLNEWATNFVFHRVAGKNLDSEMNSIAQYKIGKFADFLQNLKNKDLIKAKFLEAISWKTEADMDAGISRDIYDGAAFYFIKNFAVIYGQDKFMDLIVASGDTSDVDGAMALVASSNLGEFRDALLNKLDQEYDIYSLVPGISVPASVLEEATTTPSAATTTPALEEPATKEEFVAVGSTYLGSNPYYNCRDPLYTDAGSGSYFVGCANTAAVWRWWAVEELSVGSYKNINLSGTLGLFGTTSFGNNIGVYVFGEDPRPRLSAECPLIGSWNTDCLLDTGTALAACEVAGRSNTECSVGANIAGRDKIYIVLKVIDPTTVDATRGDFNMLKIVRTK